MKAAKTAASTRALTFRKVWSGTYGSRPKRDSAVIVAAQYILLAGQNLADDCFTKPVSGFGPDQWRRWAGKPVEISGQEVDSTCSASAAEAHKHMVSLHPEIFLASQDR
jgi:hypothetical protein